MTQQEAEVIEARENLARLMGSSARHFLDVPDDLPYVSKEEPSLKELEAKALAMNFDLPRRGKKLRSCKSRFRQPCGNDS